MKSAVLGIVILSILSVSCTPTNPLSDKEGSQEAIDMFRKMEKYSKKGIMIGYEDALAYGIDWWAEENMCDMYRVSGKYPAVYGWDLGDIHADRNLDSVSFDDMIRWIKWAHQQGGINTISWHMDNPITGASSWDRVQIAAELLPGGAHHEAFKERLDMGAEFLKKCKVDDYFVPIVFRPWHEHNGDWFWWGKGNTTEEQYVALYRFTVDYFREVHQLHHLIYAFSPDRSRIEDPTNKQEYLWGYPGDEYVDLLGIDNYKDVIPSENDSINQQSLDHFVAILETVTDLAAEKNKLSALTESGYEGIKNDNWFTERIYQPLMTSKKARRIAYILLWRNSTKKHHYMVYPGHPAEQDFINFISRPNILTLDDIKDE